jgi:hypothetical protein
MFRFDSLDSTIAMVNDLAKVLNDEITARLAATKEVSPPDEQPFETVEECHKHDECCSCDDIACTCTCMEPTPIYETTTTDSYAEPECTQIKDVMGWLSIGDGVWMREVLIPVEKQYVEVSILEGKEVHVGYEKRVEINEAAEIGYRSMAGSCVLPLIPNADVSTFKAKFNRGNWYRQVIYITTNQCRTHI